MGARKQRITIPEEISAEVIFASDNTCCVCHTPGPTQIHHIDENPANNDIDNLALLCLTCHDKTQVRGGFAKHLTAPVVRRYRNEWVKTVRERRNSQGTRTISRAQQMTTEQARESAARLRLLYKTLFAGVTGLRDYAEQMGELGEIWISPSQGETLGEREQHLKPMLDRSLAAVNSTLHDIRVEPGSQEVCRLFDHFMQEYEDYMRSIYPIGSQTDKVSSFLGALSRALNRPRLDESVRTLQAAIQRHIKAIDRLC